MATTIATTLEQTEIRAQQATNPLANVWLGILGLCLSGTLFCTAVLVAWPIIAKVVAG